VENFKLMAGHKCEALTKRCWLGFAKLFTFCSGGKRSIQTELRALFIDRSITESQPRNQWPLKLCVNLCILIKQESMEDS